MKRYKSTKYLMIFLCSLALLFFLRPSLIYAQDLGTKLAEGLLQNVYIEVDPSMTLDQAVKIQEQFVARFIKEFGEPVGYKAGLTNAVIQKIVGVSHPLRGTLLEKMLLKSGATLKGDERLRIEGDLIVRVGSDEINKAKTKEEALKCIDAAIPFIELPFIPKAGMKVSALVAINVGARYGVVGEPIPLTASREWMERLINFTVQLLDEKGAVLSQGKGSALLDDPLNVVLWVRDSLAAEGEKLKKGDLLSLGSITKMIPSKPGTTVRGKFIDLVPKGPVELIVNFK